MAHELNRRSFIGAVVLPFIFSNIVEGSAGADTSDHFDGRRYFNIDPVSPPRSSLASFIKWQFNRQKQPWKGPLANLPKSRPLPGARSSGIRATFIGHATTLIETDRTNILTDPVWSYRVGPGSIIGPNRMSEPGLDFDDLPRIDLVLVSHNHFDHMDMKTLTRLDAKHSPIFVVPKANGRYLAANGITRVVELDWWGSSRVLEDCEVTVVPARHFSNRGLFDYNTSLWGGFVISCKGDDIYFAGDTAYGNHFVRISQRFPALKLAILPIGAFRPEWMMSPVHMGPAEALKAHRDLKARFSLAVHFGTFELADDGQEEPVIELSRLTGADTHLKKSFRVLDFGDSMDVG